jgi:predicted metal-dependent hydrolase
MKRCLDYQGKQISYELTRKQVKNLNARVRRDGSLAVSAPLWCPDTQIEAFLHACLPRLMGARQARLAKREQPFLCDGKRLTVLGRPLTVRLLRGPTRQAVQQMDALCLTVRPDDPAAAYQALLDQFFLALAKQTLPTRYEQIYARYFQDRFPCPALRFRRMVSRFGSCHCTHGVITLNTYLLLAEPAAIEYVILHELVHMLRPDHSARFYACVAGYMPDYQARAASLKSVVLPERP